MIYKLTQNEHIVLKIENDIVSSIPDDPSNIDYEKYLAWIEEGNEAEEWQPESEQQ
jgi:hypothetical protein